MRMHDLSTRVMASILLAGHSLMSCSGLVDVEQQMFKEGIVASTQHGLPVSNELSKEGGASKITNEQEAFIASELVGKTFQAQVGQEVTFYKERGLLKARTPSSSSLEVYMGEINVAQSLQPRHIYIVSAEQAKNKKGYVYLDRGGLAGGMIRNEEGKDSDYLSTLPNECFCPITKEIMEEPVVAQDGHTYEKAAIKQWFSMGKRNSPKTGARLLSTELTPNHSMRSLIADLKAAIPALAKHKVDVANLETAIRLREEELQETLALKGNLLQQKQNQVAQLESQLVTIRQLTASLPLTTLSHGAFGPTTSTTNTTSQSPALRNDLRSLIVKIAERKVPCWDIIMVEGGLQEEASRSALIAFAHVLLEDLNSQLPVKQPSLVAAIKEADLKGILDRRSRIVYARINEAAEDAKDKEPHVDGKVEISTTVSSLNPSSNFQGGKRSWSEQELEELAIRASAKDLQALNQLLLIALENNSHAQFKMGKMYQNEGWEYKNEQQAVEWYQKAANQGHVAAQTNLGVMYEYGCGVAKDSKKAVEWYEKAAVQGNAIAQNNLGNMYRKGEGGVKDYRKAAEWYEKASLQGLAAAQNSLGLMYRNGYGVAKDGKKAVEWCQKAAEQGIAIAQNNLGNMYRDGQVIDRDVQKAVEWYEKAAEKGHVAAQYNLGVMYASGWGIAKDVQKAMDWFQKAAEQGDNDAQQALEKLRGRS